MYQLKKQEDSLKLYISDQEFDKLPTHKRKFYEPYLRDTPRPQSNFSNHEQTIQSETQR